MFSDNYCLTKAVLNRTKKNYGKRKTYHSYNF